MIHRAISGPSGVLKQLLPAMLCKPVRLDVGLSGGHGPSLPQIPSDMIAFKEKSQQSVDACPYRSAGGLEAGERRSPRCLPIRHHYIFRGN